MSDVPAGSCCSRSNATYQSFGTLIVIVSLWLNWLPIAPLSTIASSSLKFATEGENWKRPSLNVALLPPLSANDSIIRLTCPSTSPPSSWMACAMTCGVPPPTVGLRPLTTAFSILETVLRPRAMLPTLCCTCACTWYLHIHCL